MAVKVKKVMRYFENRCVARVYIRRSYSNIFLTITDMQNNVLKCITSGSSGIIGNKRKKRAPTAIEAIVRKCLPVFARYRLLKCGLL